MKKVKIITVSDSCYKGIREDLSGVAIKEIIDASDNFFVEFPISVVPDEQCEIENELKKAAADGAELVLTTGGTGFSVRDVTPEATLNVIEREAQGVAEAIRAYSMQFTARAMLSRGRAGILNGTLIVNLPGSPKAVKESLTYILPTLEHGLDILNGTAKDCARK